MTAHGSQSGVVKLTFADSDCVGRCVGRGWEARCAMSERMIKRQMWQSFIPGKASGSRY